MCRPARRKGAWQVAPKARRASDRSRVSTHRPQARRAKPHNAPVRHPGRWRDDNAAGAGFRRPRQASAQLELDATVTGASSDCACAAEHGGEPCSTRWRQFESIGSTKAPRRLGSSAANFATASASSQAKAKYFCALANSREDAHVSCAADDARRRATGSVGKSLGELEERRRAWSTSMRRAIRLDKKRRGRPVACVQRALAPSTTTRACAGARGNAHDGLTPRGRRCRAIGHVLPTGRATPFHRHDEPVT